MTVRIRVAEFDFRSESAARVARLDLLFIQLSPTQLMSHYIFALPHELLDTLTPRLLVTSEPPRPASPVKTEEIPMTSSGPRACNICPGAFFADVQDQRSHFRSDWHRYNVKIRLSQGNAVTLVHFTTLLDGTSGNSVIRIESC